jgi:O-antigen ligase
VGASGSQEKSSGVEKDAAGFGSRPGNRPEISSWKSMPPALAAAACVCLIATLIFLDREKARVSLALMIPILWLSICASRTVGQWVAGKVGSEASSAEFEQGDTFDAYVFSGLVILGLGVLVKRRRRVAKVLRANGPLLLFFSYCAVSICWSDFPLTAFKRWIKAVGDLSMVLIVLTDPRPRAALRRFLVWPGFVLVPLSILLIKYYPQLGRGWSDWTGEAYNLGVATGKNGLGYVCLVFGLGAIWCILTTLRRGFQKSSLRPLLANATLLLLVFWAFRLADSATSLGCFFIGGTVMLLASRPAMRRNRVLIHSMVATSLLLVMVGLFLDPAIGLTEAVGRDSSLTGRTRIWDEVLPLTVNPVFGAGYESFWLGPRLDKIWLENGQHINQAHNGYLEVYLDLGLVGLVLVLIVLIVGYRNAMQTIRRTPNLGSLQLAFVVVALIYNLTEHAFRDLHPVWIMFLLAVVSIPLELRQEFE